MVRRTYRCLSRKCLETILEGLKVVLRRLCFIYLYINKYNVANSDEFSTKPDNFLQKQATTQMRLWLI